MKKRPLSIEEKARLRLETRIDERTIDRWWVGESVRTSTRERLEEAAAKIGLEQGV
jgi:hypothetical protein